MNSVYNSGDGARDRMGDQNDHQGAGSGDYAERKIQKRVRESRRPTKAEMGRIRTGPIRFLFSLAFHGQFEVK